MPIYAYRCEECGHAKEVLQKLSDAPLKECPSCGKDGFRKQLTAASVNTGAQGTLADFGAPCSACPVGHGGPCG